MEHLIPYGVSKVENNEGAVCHPGLLEVRMGLTGQVLVVQLLGPVFI